MEAARELIKGKHWLLLTRWVNLTRGKKQMLQQLLGLNRRLMKAYLLKESLDRLWNYRYPGSRDRATCCNGWTSYAGNVSNPWRSWPTC